MKINFLTNVNLKTKNNVNNEFEYFKTFKVFSPY